MQKHTIPPTNEQLINRAQTAIRTAADNLANLYKGMQRLEDRTTAFRQRGASIWLLQRSTENGGKIMPTKPTLDYERLKQQMQQKKENQKVEKLKAKIEAKLQQRERILP